MKINRTPQKLLVAAAVVTAALTAACGNGLQTTAGADPSLTKPTASTTASSAVPSRTPSASPTKSAGQGSTEGTGTSSKPTVGAAAETCVIGDLKVGVRASEGGAAAGSNYVLLTYTNVSDSACALYGYAGVSLVGKGDGTQLGAGADRVESDQTKTVVLEPGTIETELLKIANAGNFDQATCAPTTADGFRVYPPASKDAAYVPFKTEACQQKGAAQLQVYPVGTSG